MSVHLSTDLSYVCMPCPLMSGRCLLGTGLLGAKAGGSGDMSRKKCNEGPWRGIKIVLLFLREREERASLAHQLIRGLQSKHTCLTQCGMIKTQGSLKFMGKNGLQAE